MTSALLLLLPPSETKRDGGNGALTGRSLTAPPASPGLSWPALEAVRGPLADELAALCAGDPAGAAAALKISAKQSETELARNAALRTAPHLPAVDRYTGVLYDALDAASLAPVARRWLEGHVAIHSALFGLVGAGEGIPAYRLSSGSRLPGGSLKARWGGAIGDALAGHPGLVVDLRSKGYTALGEVPLSTPSVFVEVVAAGPDGTVRALNHFNKRGKGLFVRALAEHCSARPGADTAADAEGFATLAGEAGFEVRVVDDRLVRLVVP